MKQQEKRLQTINRIEQAFLELYKTKDISRITIREVTDLAGVYRSTFYLYFTDIFAVLEAIEADILADYRQLVLPLAEKKDTGRLFSTMLALYEKHGASVTVLLGENGDVRFLQQVKQIAYPFLREYLTPEADDELADLKTEFFISGALAVITKWYGQKELVSPQKLVSFLHAMGH